MASDTAKTVAIVGGAAAVLGGLFAAFGKKSVPKLQGVPPLVRKNCNCGR